MNEAHLCVDGSYTGTVSDSEFDPYNNQPDGTYYLVLASQGGGGSWTAYPVLYPIIIGNADASGSYVSSTEITATTPSGMEGLENIIVANPDNGAVVLDDGFTYGDVVNAENLLSSDAPLSPAEGTDTNIVTFVQNLLNNNSFSDVTVSSTIESDNSQIASDGTITYGTSTVTGDVTFTLFDDTTSTTETVPVSVSEDSVYAAASMINSDLPLSPVEGTDSNIVNFLQNILNNNSLSNVTVSSTITSHNLQVGSDGTITYGPSAVNGAVTFTLFDTLYSTAQTFPVLVSEDTNSLNVQAALAALAAASPLSPVEGVDTNVITMAQNIVNGSSSGSHRFFNSGI